MRTVYEHPPRSMGFYLKYVGILFAIILPTLIIVTMQSIVFHIPPLVHLSLIAPILVMRLFMIYKPFLAQLIIIEDRHIDKSEDISVFEYAAPIQLDEIILQLELDGFERLGETQSWFSLNKDPIPIWKLSKDNGAIVAEALVNGKRYVALHSQCERGMILTFYGTDVYQVHTDKLRISSISTNLQDALAYHKLLIDEMRPTMGNVIPVKSMKHLNELSERYQDLHQQNLLRSLYHAVVVHIFFTFAVTPFPLLLNGIFGFTTITNAVLVNVPLIIFGIVMMELSKKPFKSIDPTSALKKYGESLLEGDIS